MDEKKIQEIFSDEEFVVSLLKLETPEEVQAAVKAKGLELSISDIEWIKARLLSGKTDEFSAEELEGVSGGFCITAAGVSVAAVLPSVIGGALVGGISIGGVDWYKKLSSLGFGRW